MRQHKDPDSTRSGCWPWQRTWKRRYLSHKTKEACRQTLNRSGRSWKGKEAVSYPMFNIYRLKIIWKRKRCDASMVWVTKTHRQGWAQRQPRWEKRGKAISGGRQQDKAQLDAENSEGAQARTKNLKIFQKLRRLHNIFPFHKLPEFCHLHQAAKQKFTSNLIHFQHVFLLRNQAATELVLNMHTLTSSFLYSQASPPPPPLITLSYTHPWRVHRNHTWIVLAGPPRDSYNLLWTVLAAEAEACPTHCCRELIVCSP